MRDLILELDDARIRVLLSERRRSGMHVVFAKSYTLGEGSAASNLGRVIEQAMEGQDRTRTSVLLAISDRRIVQGAVRQGTAPAEEELPQVLRSAAQKVGMFADGDSLRIGYTKLPGRKPWQAAFEAGPSALVQEYVETIRAAGFTAIRLTSIESVLAAALGTGSAPVAIADIRSDRARVLVAQGGVVLASRKVRLTYMMGGFEDGAATLTPLRAEIKRSLAFFEEGGVPAATRLCLLGDLKEEDLADPAWEETFSIPCELADPKGVSSLPSDLTSPISWFVVAIGPTILRTAVPWLVEPLRVVDLRRTLRILTQSAAGLAMVVGWLLCKVEYDKFRQVDKSELAATRAKISLLQDEIADLERKGIPPPIVAERREIVTKKRLALPVSRICAVLANGVGPEVRFSSFQLKNHMLRLEGVVNAADELSSLARFGTIDRAISAMPGVGEGTGKLLEKSASGLRFEYQAQIGGGD